jgi:hypothetical protein
MPSPAGSYSLEHFEAGHRKNLRRSSYFSVAAGVALVFFSLVWSVDLLDRSRLLPYVLLPLIFGVTGVFVFLVGAFDSRTGPIRLDLDEAGLRLSWTRGTQKTLLWDSRQIRFNLYDLRGSASPMAMTEPCILAFGRGLPRQFAISPEAFDSILAESVARGLRVCLTSQRTSRGELRFYTIRAAA